jgi:hypothetical protein
MEPDPRPEVARSRWRYALPAAIALVGLAMFVVFLVTARDGVRSKDGGCGVVISTGPTDPTDILFHRRSLFDPDEEVVTSIPAIRAAAFDPPLRIGDTVRFSEASQYELPSDVRRADCRPSSNYTYDLLG